MDRRTFLGWIGVGALASSLPVAIAACSPQTTSTTTTTESPADNFQPVGSVADLEASGQLLVESGIGAGAVLVIRDPANPDTLVAVNPSCPHAGCDVDWQAEQTAFICPCHQSKFSATGEVLEGRANRALTRYPAKIVGDQVLVSAS